MLSNIRHTFATLLFNGTKNLPCKVVRVLLKTTSPCLPLRQVCWPSVLSGMKPHCWVKRRGGQRVPIKIGWRVRTFGVLESINDLTQQFVLHSLSATQPVLGGLRPPCKFWQPIWIPPNAGRTAVQNRPVIKLRRIRFMCICGVWFFGQNCLWWERNWKDLSFGGIHVAVVMALETQLGWMEFVGNNSTFWLDQRVSCCFLGNLWIFEKPVDGMSIVLLQSWQVLESKTKEWRLCFCFANPWRLELESKSLSCIE